MTMPLKYLLIETEYGSTHLLLTPRNLWNHQLFVYLTWVQTSSISTSLITAIVVLNNQLLLCQSAKSLNTLQMMLSTEETRLSKPRCRADQLQPWGACIHVQMCPCIESVANHPDRLVSCGAAFLQHCSVLLPQEWHPETPLWLAHDDAVFRSLDESLCNSLWERERERKHKGWALGGLFRPLSLLCEPESDWWSGLHATSLKGEWDVSSSCLEAWRSASQDFATKKDKGNWLWGSQLSLSATIQSRWKLSQNGMTTDSRIRALMSLPTYAPNVVLLIRRSPIHGSGAKLISGSSLNANQTRSDGGAFSLNTIVPFNDTNLIFKVIGTCSAACNNYRDIQKRWVFTG